MWTLEHIYFYNNSLYGKCQLFLNLILESVLNKHYLALIFRKPHLELNVIIYFSILEACYFRRSRNCGWAEWRRWIWTWNLCDLRKSTFFLSFSFLCFKKKKGNSNMYLIDFMLRTKIRFYVKEVATQTICPFLSWKYFLVRICPRQPPVCWFNLDGKI